MTNRLDEGGGAGGKPMEVGETRTIIFPKSGESLTITRTDRPYIHDLCDAYNAKLLRDKPDLAANVEYFVDDNGQMQVRSTRLRAAHAPRNRLGRTYSQAEVDRIVQQKGRLLSMAMDMGAIVKGSDGTYRPA